MTRALEEYPDIERLGEPLSANWLKQEGRSAMSDLYSRFGSDIDGVFCQNDSIALGAITTMSEQGLEVPITGIDGLPEALTAIDEGRMTASHASHGTWQGGWTFVKAHDALNGWEPRDGERMLITGGSLLSQNSSDYGDIDVEAIEAKQYNETIYQADSSPYDWEKMSAAESGDDWDPQNSVRAIRREDMINMLLWDEDEKPSGYELPSIYTNTSQLDEIDQSLTDRFEADPLT
jgi:ribose transport system substrate-binding protein